MQYSIVGYVLGIFFLFFSTAFLPSLFIALFHREFLLAAIFLGTSFGVALLGGLLYLHFRKRVNLSLFSRKEGLVVVASIWVCAGVFGALPFWLSGYIPKPISAIFESVSGFTTTGASVLSDIESLPTSLLFWRSFTHFLGGLGIVVLFVAILPHLGVVSRHLFQSEVPGPETEFLHPRVRETALILLKIYLFFTFVETLCLFLLGIPLLDSLCHTFGTLATGGFSTKNASIGHYNSVAVELVIVIFMILAGINFSLYYHLVKGHRQVVWKNPELWGYLSILGIATLCITADLVLRQGWALFPALRQSLFHVTSIQTTTGYGAGNFEEWSHFSHGVLVFLMWIGGCAGSTGGGFKVIRWIVVCKYIYVQIKRAFHPHGVIPLKLGGRTLPDSVFHNVMALFALWVFILVGTTLFLTLLGMDIVTAVSASFATLNNIGPGLGDVGPLDNYGWMPESAKLVLILCMLFGRLEVFTLLVLFFPSFWRE